LAKIDAERIRQLASEIINEEVGDLDEYLRALAIFIEKELGR
jgi:hypothetical protein